MKKLTLVALFVTGLATAAPAAITAGLDAGYLIDNKDAYWSGRVGWEFKSTANLSHQVELEFGHTKHEEEIAPGFPTHLETKLAPITINYRAETTRANKLGFYYGAGIGQSKVKYSFPGSGVPVLSDSANATAYQAFAGISYKASAAATLHAGVKYLKIDDVTFSGMEIEVGDDLALTAGVSIRF